MPFLQWAFFELASYGVLPWLVFLGITVLAAWLGRRIDILIGRAVIAAMVFALDLDWVQTAQHAPGWDPNAGPDPDFVFGIGTVIRVVMVLVVLWPVTAIVKRLRQPRAAVLNSQAK